ncbi:MAG: two-component system chemotaxis sensor kinase CheA [Enterobacterales bacterium]|jgi:two-component system chemotaxis sensor kinase CheA
MTIDLSQFHQVFYDESFEGLDTMEELLLSLSDGNVDNEAVNTIFRSAHSIKGGSATFGFTAVAEFTHILESLLDEMREGEREVTTEAITLLLESVDCMREMLSELQEDGQCADIQAKELGKKFQAMLDDGAPNSTNEQKVEQASTDSDVEISDQWKIVFKPQTHILSNGNEPLRMFREIESLGDCKVKLLESSVPGWNDFKADDLYLEWEIHLTADIAKEDLDEVFEWVIDECELIITNLPINALDDEGQRTADIVKITDSKTESEIELSTSTEVVKQKEPKKEVNRTSSSIRVGIEKVDSLINLVGELVITQSMLSQVGGEFTMDKLETLRLGLSQLEQNTRELQESVMQIRMMPISFAFNRFPRMVRDLAMQLDKKIDLEISGETTELDKTVMERIGDPLVHLVRNSLDHGIENPKDRLAKGKPETGTINLDAYHQGGNIIIEIRDDGAGINIDKVFKKAVEKGLVSAKDELTNGEIYNLLFEPGFSTADIVSDVSGRGVGMDVVKRNINILGGSIEVESEQDVGSTFKIRLPLTLAILDGQLIRVGDQTYIIPLMSVNESLQIKEELISCVGGELDLYQLREDYVPIINVANEFGFENDTNEMDESLLVVVEGENQQVGLLVDELLTQQQVVIKSLDVNYKPVSGISGATILGDGKVALIIDVVGFIQQAKHIKKAVMSNASNAA